jgi:2-polyprenyl-6-hydroxyphenyl methylase/3-demethylubiquinone-9 3-methyltransferase
MTQPTLKLSTPPAHGTATFAPTLDCKCCGGAARLDGYADFARDCYGYNARRGLVSGLPIPYYRCAGCDFCFTNSFDGWSDADFRQHIYNEDYGLFDPNFAQRRPHKTAARVADLVRSPATRILDYGCGNGLTVELLRAAGYADVTGYDPHHANPVRPLAGDFDFVICVEVAEHTTRPLELFADLSRLTAEHGVILLSTRDFSEVQGRWVDDWYVAPRNGHVSFYTQRTLSLLAASIGRDYLKIDTYRHLLTPRNGQAG